MLTLNGINLTPHGSDLKWIDKWTAQNVAQSVTETLGGGIIVYALSLPVGQHITLVADDEWGWLRADIVEQIKELADDPGAVMALNINGVEYSVMFRHHEPPAFDVRPLIPRLAELADDYFTGTIKLIRV